MNPDSSCILHHKKPNTMQRVWYWSLSVPFMEIVNNNNQMVSVKARSEKCEGHPSSYVAEVPICKAPQTANIWMTDQVVVASGKSLVLLSLYSNHYWCSLFSQCDWSIYVILCESRKKLPLFDSEKLLLRTEVYYWFISLLKCILRSKCIITVLYQ